MEIKLENEWQNVSGTVSYVLNTHQELIQNISITVNNISTSVSSMAVKQNITIFAIGIPVIIIIISLTTKLLGGF